MKEAALAGLTIICQTGDQISTVFDELARLRISVFRDFPYLYAGSLDYEKTYLQTYAAAPRAFLFAIYDAGQMVGATTCIPLADETPEVKAPFQQAGFDLLKVFYFGESLLLPAYRGRGLGHLFFHAREAHAASFGTYEQTCFCAVVRPDDHPLRPPGYRPLDVFWTKRGYQREDRLQSQFIWPDLGEQSPTAKPMVYWLRRLSNE